MAHGYKQWVGVPEYCAAIDADHPNHSPFVAIAALKDPNRLLKAAGEDIDDLASDGFFLIDQQGRLVSGANRLGNVTFVIAPHVAQRQKDGRGEFPKHFCRRCGARCGFGGPYAKTLNQAQAESAVGLAWTEWNLA